MKKHKLFYNFTNITIKMVKFDPNSISCIRNLLLSFNRSFQLCVVGYSMSVLGGFVLGTFPYVMNIHNLLAQHILLKTSIKTTNMYN